MAWFAELAGRAEDLLNNLDEQTGAAIRNHNVKRLNINKNDYPVQDTNRVPRSRQMQYQKKIVPSITESRALNSPSKKVILAQSRPLFNNRKDSPTYLDRNVMKKCSQRVKTPIPPIPFNLNKCPKTLVNDFPADNEIMELHGSRLRRHSLPPEINLMNKDIDVIFHMQNLEVENTMLKNEVNFMYKEVSELLNKLKMAQESKDINQTYLKLEDSVLLNQKASQDNASLASQLDLLKTKINEIAHLEINYHSEKQSLIIENNDLEERVTELTKKLEDNNSLRHKLETDLRHAQTTITTLQSNLEKSNGECHRLENDWEAYKLRVKSMLFAKDNEIKELQEGMNQVDAKTLVKQLDSLKEERDELSELVSSVRKECETMKQYLSQVESRRSAAEKVAGALRDALRDERAARNNVEAQCFVISRDLKMLQMETGQTIASLRTALRDKESEINLLRETASSVKTPDASALNVADYDATRDNSIENEKIHYLTESLVQRQAKVERLIAENNMFRIQLDKLESKLKSEINNRPKDAQSVVNVQGGEHRMRRVRNDSCVNVLSNRMAAVIRRHPVLRIFVIFYMICLHFWVLTVLFTSTPAVNLMQGTSVT